MERALDKRTFYDEFDRKVIRPEGKPIISRPGVYAVVPDRSRMLFSICARSGHFDLPGGKLEEGETIDECLEREGLEETGYLLRRLSPKPVAVLQRQFYWSPEDTYFMSTLLVYQAYVEEAPPEGWRPHDPAEVAGVVWVDVHKLHSVPVNPCYIEALKDHYR